METPGGSGEMQFLGHGNEVFSVCRSSIEPERT
jgi:hypothetical protein